MTSSLLLPADKFPELCDALRKAGTGLRVDQKNILAVDCPKCGSGRATAQMVPAGCALSCTRDQKPGCTGLDIAKAIRFGRPEVDVGPAPFQPPMGTRDTWGWPEYVQDQLVRKAARVRAEEIWLAREAESAPQPRLTALVDLLAEPDEDTPWRVQSLWPTGGNVVLAAQRKSGKTTMVGNAVRCLADGGAFLGSDMGWVIADQHVTAQLKPDERVAVLDLELPRNTLRGWLRDQKIINTDRVYVESLRGRTAELRLLDDALRGQWAEYLAGLGTRVLIVDPLAPLLRANGIAENDNDGIGDILAALDSLKVEAGISELLLVHHAGHTGERSRGASRLRDWPDVEWILNREDSDDSASPRYFQAYGRDVEVSETRLDYLHENRKLTMAGGTRRDATGDRIKSEILSAVAGTPGITKRDLEARIRGNNDAKRNALADLIQNSKIKIESNGRAQLHYLGGD